MAGLWVALLIGCAGGAAGCVEQVCEPPLEGQAVCASVERTTFLLLRAGSVGIGLFASLLVVMLPRQVEHRGLVCLIALVAAGVGAHRVWPADEEDPLVLARTRRREAVAAQAAEARRRVAEAEAAARRERESAGGQLRAVTQMHKRLFAHQRKRIRPLRQRYTTERRRYAVKLGRALSKERVTTHEALRRAAGQKRAVIELLERAAVLDHALAELARQDVAAQTALFELDASAWRLRKLRDMDELGAGSLRGLVNTSHASGVSTFESREAAHLSARRATDKHEALARLERAEDSLQLAQKSCASSATRRPDPACYVGGRLLSPAQLAAELAWIRARRADLRSGSEQP